MVFSYLLMKLKNPYMSLVLVSVFMHFPSLGKHLTFFLELIIITSEIHQICNKKKTQTQKKPNPKHLVSEGKTENKVLLEKPEEY